MAVYVIPKKTKVKMEVFRGVTLGDVLYVMMCLGVAILFFTSNLPGKIFLALGVPLILLVLLIRNNGVRIYSNIGWLFRFFSFKKKYSTLAREGKPGNIKMLAPYVKIDSNDMEGAYIDYKEYFAKVLEIFPANLGLLQEDKQDRIISAFANGLRRVGQGQFAQIVKLNKPLILDNLHETEVERMDAVGADYKLGIFTKDEIDARSKVFESRLETINYFNNDEKAYKDYFYLVVYGTNKRELANTISGIKSSLESSSTPVMSRELDEKELCVFLKANYGRDFDEREIQNIKKENYVDWIMPKEIKFSPLKATIDGNQYSYFTVTDYPLTVYNAWGLALTQIEGARVVVNFKPLGKLAAERLIDRSIIEMETQRLYSAKLSQQIDKDTALETMKELLVSLKNENEQLFDCTIHICADTKNRREVRSALKENNFRYNEMFCRQIDAFISANISKKDTITEAVRGMQTSSLAAFFPFVASDIQDDGGVYIGYGNGMPAFVNFFSRKGRQNSNMIVVGKPGSGKSFATKALLANLAADDSKIFILDPEEEYKRLARSLGGNLVDVGSGSLSRFNPFHIYEDLEMDEDEKQQKSQAGTFESHLQFLEEFFRFILDGISPDALEMLNTTVAELYKQKKIGVNSDFSKLKPEDYPTFDELLALVNKKLAKTKDHYEKDNLKTILVYITKFASGGRNAGLWNGPSSISSKENFVLFSFRSLLANRNKQIATAQMLLVFKYLNNEIIKNMEFNDRYRKGLPVDKKRKIIVVVDEAHLFMNPKYPIALDFMFDMAKRIRKYNGMQIIITQNIRDFMGSEDMIRQSSAIIAASQYSMIFSLAPNDVTELVKLYKNAGEINETEQDRITNAGTGDCFLITGPMSRTQVHIYADSDIRSLFDSDFAAAKEKETVIEQQTSQAPAEEDQKEVQTENSGSGEDSSQLQQ